MGLLRTLVSLPVAGPVKGTLWLAGKVQEAAEQEFNNPGSIRKELVALESQLLAGEISEDAYDVAETALLIRLKAAQ